jgi:hypothetical protein
MRPGRCHRGRARGGWPRMQHDVGARHRQRAYRRREANAGGPDRRDNRHVVMPGEFVHRFGQVRFFSVRQQVTIILFDPGGDAKTPRDQIDQAVSLGGTRTRYIQRRFLTA